uniref:class I SAM-dependent DNA methyltransferase n=1 Tax=Saccharopolyspora galaxeae TaxID=2781241 RepID=UPI00190AC6DB|nr:class I SAM-dependent methyltransferase [Saccharopolyspora sp. HNM0986]
MRDFAESSRREQAAAFDTIGDAYDAAFGQREAQLAAGEWLAGALPQRARVLDLGCGTGLPTAAQLVDAGFDVTGVDISAEMLRLARGNVPEADLHRRDMLTLRPDGADGLGRFDAATAFFSLLMLSRAEIAEMLATLGRLLVPGGLLALSMVEMDQDYQQASFLGSEIRVSGYPRQELSRMLEPAGFTILEDHVVAYQPTDTSTGAEPEMQHYLRCRRD